MEIQLDFEIGDSSLCSEVKQCGFVRFRELAEHVRALPYRRIESTDAAAVLREGGGTCSTKHRLLALVAHESGQFEVQLTVGIYEMSERNTPGVHSVLSSASLPLIPEAHCYLTVCGERLDFTGLPSGTTSPFDSLLLERFILPGELPSIKDSVHREFLSRWAHEHGLLVEEVWSVREACIAALSANKALQPTFAKPRAVES